MTVPCFRCGSHRVIPDVRLVDEDSRGNTTDEQALVFRKPDAWFFKQGTKSTIQARVCADCGHMETYVLEPRKLWHAYLEAEGLRAEDFCDKCGYDLRGHLYDGTCPECGDAFRRVEP